MEEIDQFIEALSDLTEENRVGCVRLLITRLSEKYEHMDEELYYNEMLLACNELDLK